MDNVKIIVKNLTIISPEEDKVDQEQIDWINHEITELNIVNIHSPGDGRARAMKLKSVIVLPFHQESQQDSYHSKGLSMISEESNFSQIQKAQGTLQNMEMSQHTNQTNKTNQTNQKKKRNVKRSQTQVFIPMRKTLSQPSKNRGIEKKSKNKITRQFERILKQKSQFTIEMKSNTIKKGIIPIKVDYFDKPFSKILLISDQTLALEFITKAIEEYRKEEKFDQKLLRFPNYQLAYRLVMETDQKKKLQRVRSFAEDLSVEESKAQSMEDLFVQEQEEEGDLIVIDFGSTINFKNVYLVENTESLKFGMDPLIALQTCKQYPNHQIVLIEDQIMETYYHVLVLKTETLEVCHEQLSKKVNKYSKRDYYFTLKYNCSNFGQEPLNDKIPIGKLPLFWLLIIKKLPSTVTTEKKIEQNILDLSGTKSQRILTEESKNLEANQKLSQMFSYQEFKLIKVDGKYRNSVILGIDYFDIYYTYQSRKNNPFALYKWLKSLAKYLMEEPSMIEKNYRRIPLIQIKSIKMFPECFQITYHKSQDQQKKIQFAQEPPIDRSTEFRNEQTYNEAYAKLEFLLSSRLEQFE